MNTRMRLVLTHFVALLAASVLGYLGMAALTFLFSDGPNTTVADFVSGIGFLALGYFYGYGAWRGMERWSENHTHNHEKN